MTPLDPQLEQQWTQACRSCGARILWATTGSGKSVPVDVGQVYGGNLVLEADEVGIRARYQKPAGDVEAWVSHFSTCPQAGEHRKPKAELAGGYVLDFGKHAGKRLDAIEVGYLKWLRGKLQDNLDEPERAHLRPKNVLLIEAIGATLKAKGHE